MRLVIALEHPYPVRFPVRHFLQVRDVVWTKPKREIAEPRSLVGPDAMRFRPAPIHGDCCMDERSMNRGIVHADDDAGNARKIDLTRAPTAGDDGHRISVGQLLFRSLRIA